MHPFSELRDELYAHLCKQTCYNPRPAVLHKGLELLAVICAIYPPSGILEPYVVSYLREHLKDHKEKEAQYAACCLRRLKNTSLMGAMKSLPSSQDLEKLIATTLDSYFFESTIEQVMQKQKNEFPDLNVPVILPYMTSLIVQVGLSKFLTFCIFPFLPTIFSFRIIVQIVLDCLSRLFSILLL